MTNVNGQENTLSATEHELTIQPRIRDVVRRIRANGAQDVTRRMARRIATNLSSKFNTSALDFPLLPQDIADSTRLRLEPPMKSAIHKKQLNLAWLCTPPGPGSGGHTTLFRMVSGLEDRGHKCTLLLYDRHGSDMRQAASVIRSHWPSIKADICAVPTAIEGYDGCVASSWETAHVLASRGRSGMHRFYFIQDFEPYFYPRGSLYSLAEDSYRFGFRNIALGAMVANAVRNTLGTEVADVAFGCDTDVYGLRNTGGRRGVVFYARETSDRRGFVLGKLALEEFHRRHPEQLIHIYGDAISHWPIPHFHHGKLRPAELNLLYNSSIAGLAMSFTNISLVAEEMLACGMTPVVNDHSFARMDLLAPGVRWAPATPGGIADALCQAVERPLTYLQASTMAAGARRGWSATQASVADIIETEAGTCRI